MSPGKQVPVVTTFCKNEEDIFKYNPEKTIDTSRTMKEKIQELNSSSIVVVHPVSFFSKTFGENQIRKYKSMEKEFWAMMYLLPHAF